MEPIVLASSSPRRQQILKELDIPFIVHPANIEETFPKNISLSEVPEFIASQKVNAVIHSLPVDQEIPWVLGADTIILYKNKIYGKPKDEDEAFSFLKTLQGNTHKVITGLALFNGELHYLATRTSVNKVTFAPMSDEELNWYVKTSEWHGAAGAYRIQGLASCFISKLEGTESSVMGLPIFELCDIFKEQNYSFRK
ncbi:MAG: Maf family protein [Treponema sp.]